MPCPYPPAPGSWSPWGVVQTVTSLGPDAVFVTTPGHGGLCVSQAAFARLPAAMRQLRCSGGGWFEEDADWALPYLFLGLDRFEADQGAACKVRTHAERIVTAFRPDHAATLGLAAAKGGVARG